MKPSKVITSLSIILAVAIGGLFMASRTSPEDSANPMATAPSEPVVKGLESFASKSAKTVDSPVEVASQPASEAGWVNNGGQFTSQTAQLHSWVEAGYPVDIRIGASKHRYGFRPLGLTAENFQISTGADSSLPATYNVYSGRELSGASGVGESAALAIVNGAISMALTLDGENFLVETDPETGELYATNLHPFDNGHSCGNGSCEGAHVQCELSEDGRMAVAGAPEGSENVSPERLPVSLIYPGDRIDAAAVIEAAEEPQFEASTSNNPYSRNGAEYDASLKDFLVLMVSAKAQSGPTSGLSSKAATYFAFAAKTADIYERQLGFRYLLQELVLVPSDSSETDPGNPSGTELGADLYHFKDWIVANRPQSTYKWGHAALWTFVDGSGGGYIGLAWTDSFGEALYGHSVQEPAWGWEVHAHELGHNVGSSHTSGGVMNASDVRDNGDFYTYVQGQNYTAAKDIYNYMTVYAQSYILGSAPLRHPEEIPWGVDDSVTTAQGTPVSFNPLSNDLTQVPSGAGNNLDLVEVGQVLPKAAGSARLSNGQIEFIPAAGFTGQAWFSYTLSGDVGNGGLGWLHRADVVVTVGGNSTAPSTTPALNLTNDSVVSELSGPIRINPLLNDEGTGRLWSGDVEAVIGPNDSTPESYTDGAFWLVDATILEGTGTLSLEKRNMTRSTSSALLNSGYITYTPGQNESGQVIIEYTVSDASGNTATAQVVIAEAAAVGVTADTNLVAEDSGDIVTLTFQRSGAADTSVEETIDFLVSGTASPDGLPADFALAGQTSFDPLTGAGSIVIPVGETQAFIFVAIDNDGISEGQESIGVSITNTSSLLVGGNGSAEISINDSSLVYAESFDSFSGDSATWNGWINLKDKRSNGKGGDDWFDWAIDSYTTPTNNTGPSGDHTLGSGKYLFAEASGNSNLYSILQSPSISTSGVGAADLEFWYHMYGSGIGSLSLDLYADGVLVASNVWSAAGQQSTSGTDWKKAVVELNTYLPAASVQLRFRVDTTGSDLGDIAIDDVQIVGQSGSAPQAPSIWIDPSGCTVESGQSVYLSVIAEAFPAPQIQWEKDGVAIPGATGAAYFIAAADQAAAGNYKALVTNSEGSVYSFAANISVPDGSAYFTWASNKGLPPEESSEMADPDLDGIVNILEFAFGTEPMSASASQGRPGVSLQQDAGSTYLQIQYRRRVGGSGTAGVNYTADGVTYTVETSTTLAAGSWSSGPGVVQMVGSPVANGDGTETVTVRRSAPLGGGSVFLRVSVVSN